MQTSTVKVLGVPSSDCALPWYDNTKLSAVNVCPTWGVLRYGHNKTMATPNRVLPLDAGSVCHECFAVLRLWQLHTLQHLPEHADFQGRALFGDDRWSTIRTHFDNGTDQRRCRLLAALAALDSSGYYDEPDNKRLTLTNIENSITAYADKYPYATSSVWVADPTDPTSAVGVEQRFDVLLSIDVPEQPPRIVRFAGCIDGIHVRRGKIIIEENKTGARMNEAWRDSFALAHQVTGYIVVANWLTQTPIDSAMVRGLAIPLPAKPTYDSGGVANEYVTRPPWMIDAWAQWVLYSVGVYEDYMHQLDKAPMFTHSCNRYFRSCSFLPYCSAPPDERANVYNMMTADTWDPRVR